MGGTLRDKILEFRELGADPLLQEILDNEKRSEFKRRARLHSTQLYRNVQELENAGKWNAIRIQEQRRHECALLDMIKAKESEARFAIEKSEKDERLAKEIQKLDRAKEAEVKNRIQLRNKEPELRDLAAKIRQRIHGQSLAAQIQYNMRQKKAEVEKEQELDRQLLEAALMNDMEESRKAKLREMKQNEELKRFLAEEDVICNAKVAALTADKEDSKRLVDELVQEENRLIAEENAEKWRKRQEWSNEYNQFLANKKEKDSDLEREKNYHKMLLEDQRMIYERQQAEERRKKDAVNRRIQLQATVGLKTAELCDSYERNRFRFVEVNEELERSKAALEEYNWAEEEQRKKRIQEEKFGQELRQLKEYRRKLREEEDAKEHEQDRILMETMTKAAAEKEAEKNTEKQKLMDEMKQQLDDSKKYKAEDRVRELQLEEEYRRFQDDYNSRVAAERQAMQLSLNREDFRMKQKSLPYKETESYCCYPFDLDWIW
ncbi:hypothetical protein FGIG_00709 [Fasciola gigantica]|uniref:Trichohyalin-plectin-homology domain-containing protein n=1 Tax=Fasciola gigantica TaxID=46835 RepID=A0A504Y4Z3_FASGI|nr:hypothetical protein FGIG_00709 [Fasciola gigantica]